MYNVGYQVMNNLVLPKEDKPKEEQSNGLLARNIKNSSSKKEEDVKDRVARYVAEIRKARMELKNG
jgi:hypothetical protein